MTDARVERARVRSRAQLDYVGVQREINQAPDGSTLALLRTVGELRIAQEAERGGVSLPMPAQEVDLAGDHYRLEFREMLPVESWNAQLSLLTGFAAASLMIEGQVGILRTLPPAPDHAVQQLRRTARALGLDWPRSTSHQEFIRSLDAAHPAEAAMVVACTRLLRGAGYASFHGHVPDQPQHAALASPYAHVTAPLRRLVDRYGLEICAALCAGTDVPPWVLDRMDDLPDVMRDSGRTSRAYENAVVNLVEALTLRSRVGETLRGRGDRGRARRPARGHRDGPGARDRGAGDLHVAAAGRRGRHRHAGRGRPRHPEGALHPRIGPILGARMGWPGDRDVARRRGRSGLHRTRWWVTPTRGDPRDQCHREQTASVPVFGQGRR